MEFGSDIELSTKYWKFIKFNDTRIYCGQFGFQFTGDVGLALGNRDLGMPDKKNGKIIRYTITIGDLTKLSTHNESSLQAF
jgi:hypothetical protein